eukprot:2486855-Prymnesium_polylepis.1
MGSGDPGLYGRVCMVTVKIDIYATSLTLSGVMELMALSPSLSLSSLCMLALARSNEGTVEGSMVGRT